MVRVIRLPGVIPFPRPAETAALKQASVETGDRGSLARRVLPRSRRLRIRWSFARRRQTVQNVFVI